MPIAPSIKHQRWPELATVALAALALGAYATAWGTWQRDIGPILGYGNSIDAHLPFLLSGLIAWMPGFGDLVSSDWYYYRDAVIGEGEMSTIFYVHLAVALLGGLVAAVAAVWWRWVPGGRDLLIHVSGPVLHDRFADAIARLKRQFRREVRTDSLKLGARLHPEIRIPLRREPQGIQVYGAPGSGKTNAIFLGLIADVVARNDRALIYDPKPEFTSFFHQRGKSLIIAPWDRRSAAWDIAADCPGRAEAELLSEQLVPAAKGDNAMFSNAARIVLTGLVVSLGKIHGRKWGWAELAAAVHMSDNDLMEMLAGHAPFASAFLAKESKTSQSILINMRAFLGFLDFLALAWPRSYEKGWSVMAWTKNRRTRYRRIFLQNADRYPFGRYVVSAVLALHIRTRLSLPDSHDPADAIWLLLDEFPSLPNASGAATPPVWSAIERGRSKQMRVVVGIQDSSQLRDRYSRELADVLSSMLGIMCAFRVSGTGDTAEWVSKSLGERTVERPNISYSSDSDGERGRSTTYQREVLRLVRPEDVTDLPAPTPKTGITGYVRVAGVSAVYRLHWPLTQLRPVCPPSVPAAWTEDVDTVAEVPDLPSAPVDKTTSTTGGGRELEPEQPEFAGIDPALTARPRASKTNDLDHADIMADSEPATESSDEFAAGDISALLGPTDASELE